MKNIIQVVLFKNSDCDICKLMQQELTNNPPAADVRIIDVRRDNVSGYPYRNRVKIYPTTVIYVHSVIYTYPYEIAWFEGFVNSELIDDKINEFNKKFKV